LVRWLNGVGGERWGESKNGVALKRERIKPGKKGALEPW